jgi:thioredoxin 1
MMEKVLHVEAADWQGIETSTKPVFLDFWAEWCGPCKMLAPTFARLAEKYGEQVTFAKVNVDELPDIANKFGVRSIPTLVLLQQGNVVERLVGLRSEQELAQVLSRYANRNGSK